MRVLSIIFIIGIGLMPDWRLPAIAGELTKNLENPSAQTETDGPSALRGLKWGMSQEDVLKAEKKTPMRSKDGSGLLYEEKLGGVMVMLHYGFTHNRLSSATYFLKGEISKPYEAFRIAESWLKRISSKYGKPMRKVLISRPGKLAAEPGEESVVKAISSNQALIKVVWKKPEAFILLEIAGSNGKIYPFIKYMRPKDFEKELKKMEKTRDEWEKI